MPLLSGALSSRKGTRPFYELGKTEGGARARGRWCSLWVTSDILADRSGTGRGGRQLYKLGSQGRGRSQGSPWRVLSS